MCQILQSVTEYLVYHYRLYDNDNLDDIALSLEQYLNKAKKRRIEKPPDYNGFHSFSLDAKTELRIYNGNDSDISSIAPKRNIYARPGRLFERTESLIVNTTKSRSFGFPMVKSLKDG